MVGFSEDPQTIWLTQAGMDCDMSLHESFWFEDRSGRRWAAPKGSVINGASIPRALWTIVGSPYTGDYRRASIVHDVACKDADADARREADRMFFEACREGGCSRWEATVLYVGVRIGAWWQRAVKLDAPTAVRLTLRSDEVQLIHDFQQVCQTVLEQGETDEAAIVESRVDSAFAMVATQRLALASLTSSAFD